MNSMFFLKFCAPISSRWRSRGCESVLRSAVNFHWRTASGSALWARRDPSPLLLLVGCCGNRSHDGHM